MDIYARLAAKLDVADAWIAEHGMLNATSGEPAPVMRLYVSLANSARLSLARLEQHLDTRACSPEAALRDYIDAEYGDRDES